MPNPALRPGTTYYNGIYFGVYTQTTKYDLEMSYDAAGRTVAAVIYTISLKGPVFYGVDAASGLVNLSDKLTIIIQKLSAPGGEFHYDNGSGMRPLTINAPGALPKDVLWGPKPKLISIKPHGGGEQGAAEVEWTVQVAIPECGCGAPTYKNALMEVNFTIQFAIDKSGYTKRTYAGFLRIPLTRQNVCARILIDNADNYRDKIVPQLLLGFRRTTEDFGLDESKTKLTWTIIDEEMPPTVPPPGVVEVTASHRVSNTSNSPYSWWGTISATYEVARYVPRTDALDWFAKLFNERFQKAKENFRTDPTIAGDATTALIRQISMEETEIYGTRCASFSGSYSFACDPRRLLIASGLWLPVSSSDWSKWAFSLSGSAQNQRGNAQLRFNNDEDVIIDLCLQDSIKPPQSNLRPPAPPASSLIALLNDYPPPDNSWMEITMNARIDSDERVLEHKPLAQSVALTAQGSGGQFTMSTNGGGLPESGKGGGIINNQTPPSQPFGGILSSVLQRSAVPSIYATITGRALRAGWLINPPVVTQIGGVPAVPANEDGVNYFRHSVVANFFGVPIVAAAWNLRYVLPNLPVQGVSVPPSPLLGVGV